MSGSRNLLHRRLSYLSRCRAQGCLAVISMWVQNGFSEPQEFIVKTISELDSSMGKLFKK